MKRNGNKIKTGWWVGFVLVILASFVIRFIKLDLVPSSLYYDEIDLAYQVKSFLATGKDYRNVSSPFFFKSFNTDKTPFPIYFSIIPSLLFSSPEYKARAGAALAGVICVVLGMLIAHQLTKQKLATLIVGIVFAFSPWQIQFSRMAFEAIFMLMVFMASISTFLYWIDSRKTWVLYFSAFLLGLNVYTYRTMSLFAPMTIVVLFLIFFRDFKRVGVLKTGIFISILGAMILPFIYATTIGSADQTRIGQISIFSDPLTAIKIQRNREVDSEDFKNPEIGKNATISSFVFHNKILSYINFLGKNYYQNFSADFLFLSGDPNGRHSPTNTGVLLFVDIVGLIAGLIYVFKNTNNNKIRLLLALLFLSPIPSDLTLDGANHASRLMILSAPLLIIIGIGYTNLYFALKKNWIGLISIVALVSVWICAVIFYFHQYFVHFPIDSSRQFGFGYKEAIQKINLLKSGYKHINLTASNDPPLLYYLFWSNTSPRDLQKYGTNFDKNTTKNLPLDNVRPFILEGNLCSDSVIAKMDPETIYMVSFRDIPLDFRSTDKDKIPAGIKLLDVIKYPDNEVAYYLITRDPGVKPIKRESCR